MVTLIDDDVPDVEERRRDAAREALHEGHREPVADPTRAVTDKANLVGGEPEDHAGAVD